MYLIDERFGTSGYFVVMTDYCYYFKIRGDSLKRNVAVRHWDWSQRVEAYGCVCPHAGMFECSVTLDSKFESPIGCDTNGSEAVVATRKMC